MRDCTYSNRLRSNALVLLGPFLGSSHATRVSPIHPPKHEGRKPHPRQNEAEISLSNLSLRSDCGAIEICDILFPFPKAEKVFWHLRLVYLGVDKLRQWPLKLTAQPKTTALMFKSQYREQGLLIHAWWAHSLRRSDTVYHPQLAGRGPWKRELAVDIFFIYFAFWVLNL